MPWMELTQDEKQRAWKRIRYGARTQEPLVGHIMLHLNHTIKQMECYPEHKDLAIKYRIMHRLVKRGIISTHAQYNRIAKNLLDK